MALPPGVMAFTALAPTAVALAKPTNGRRSLVDSQINGWEWETSIKRLEYGELLEGSKMILLTWICFFGDSWIICSPPFGFEYFGIFGTFSRHLKQIQAGFLLDYMMLHDPWKSLPSFQKELPFVTRFKVYLIDENNQQLCYFYLKSQM